MKTSKILILVLSVLGAQSALASAGAGFDGWSRPVDSVTTQEPAKEQVCVVEESTDSGQREARLQRPR